MVDICVATWKEENLSDEELEGLFQQLFPNGPAGHDVMLELAPDGWESSPLRKLYEPAVGSGIPRLRPGRTGTVPEGVIDPEVELRQIIGLCVWSIFSDNHDVIATDGRLANLGTFRGSAEFITEWINESVGVQVYDYMFFYSGLDGKHGFLNPVYSLIQVRLAALGFRWSVTE